MLSIEQLATAIDCEGCIGINRLRSAKTCTKPQFSARVFLGMNHPAIPTMLYNRFGGSLTTRKSVCGRLPIIVWSVVGNGAAKPVLEALLPHLVIKQDQAKNALQMIAYIDSFPRVRKGIRGWTKETNLDVLNSFHKTSQELNHRAPATTERENLAIECDSLNLRESVREESEAVLPLASSR